MLFLKSLQARALQPSTHNNFFSFCIISSLSLHKMIELFVSQLVRLDEISWMKLIARFLLTKKINLIWISILHIKTLYILELTVKSDSWMTETKIPLYYISYGSEVFLSSKTMSSVSDEYIFARSFSAHLYAWRYQLSIHLPFNF